MMILREKIGMFDNSFKILVYFSNRYMTTFKITMILDVPCTIKTGRTEMCGEKG